MDGLESVILADPNSESYNFAESVYEKIKKKDGMKIHFGKVDVLKFADNESNIQIADNVRGKKCYFIHDASKHSNDWVMEAVLVNDALKRASAYSINDVFPYMRYSRQDRLHDARVPISARAIADCISLHADRVITTDLHSGQVQGFYNIPFDNLRAFPMIVSYIETNHPYIFENCVVVSPDVGGVNRARSFAKKIGAGIALIDKRRPKPNESEVMHVVGDVNGKNVLLIDDIIDTGGTLVRGAMALKKCGAQKMYACGTHAVFSGNAYENLLKTFDRVLITDTIPRKIKDEKMTLISLTDLYAEAIWRINKGMSISKLFEDAPRAVAVKA